MTDEALELRLALCRGEWHRLHDPLLVLLLWAELGAPWWLEAWEACVVELWVAGYEHTDPSVTRSVRERLRRERRRAIRGRGAWHYHAVHERLLGRANRRAMERAWQVLGLYPPPGIDLRAAT